MGAFNKHIHQHRPPTKTKEEHETKTGNNTTANNGRGAIINEAK
jgi:hypothetical protein